MSNNPELDAALAVARLASRLTPKTENEIRYECAALADENRIMYAAVDAIMVGGNHLACALIKELGGNFSEKYPPTMKESEAFHALQKTGAYDVWTCWAAIMRARSTMDGVIDPKLSGPTNAGARCPMCGSQEPSWDARFVDPEYLHGTPVSDHQS